MWIGWMARSFAGISVLALWVSAVGCSETRDRAGAVESEPRSITAESSTDQRAAEESALLDVESPEAILEFGLFGPVVPVGSEVYESDCRFDDAPYETCL